MKQSESIKELATALCLAQAEMGGAVKDSKNPFFKSSYADLTSVIAALKGPFSNHGLSFVQLPVSTDTHIGVMTMLMHTSGEWIQSEYVLPMTKRDPQAAGSCLTYSRRYALQSLAGLPSVDDDAESSMLRGDQAKQQKVRDVAIENFTKAAKANDAGACQEMWAELSTNEREAIWANLNAPTRSSVKELLKVAA